MQPSHNEIFQLTCDRKGVADEELAKKEAERAKQRALAGDSDPEGGPSRRRRSASFDSVSTVSTRRSSASPAPRRQSPSPPPRERQAQASFDQPRRPDSRSMSPEDNYERSHSPHARRSPPPPTRRERSVSRDSLSPPRHRERRYRERSIERGGRLPPRSPGLAADDPDPRPRSRSPGRSGGVRYDGHRGGRRDGGRRGDGPPKRQEPPRERSLSPFSKRQALTQSMNRGGR